MEGIILIAKEYGFSAVLSLAALAALAYLVRVALRNPMEIVSQALQDVNVARKALREESDLLRQDIAERDRLIETLREKIKDLEEEE